MLSTYLAPPTTRLTECMLTSDRKTLTRADWKMGLAQMNSPPEGERLMTTLSR